MTGSGTSMEWLQLVVTIIGLLSVFVKIGNTQGKQDEKNKNFEETQRNQDKKIEAMQADITTIKSDVSFIKGSLEGKI